MERIFFYPKLASGYKGLKLSTEARSTLIIFDVGANKGQSVRFFKNLYPNSKIYAFEPSIRNFKALKLYITKKKYKGVFALPIALGGLHREIVFYESNFSETSTFILPNYDSKSFKIKNRILFQKDINSYKSTLAQVIKLDNFVDENKINQIDILKIDVEGYELEVIKGASKTLKQGIVKIVQFESHDDDMREDNFNVIDSILREYKFMLHKEIRHPFGNFREILYQQQ